MAGPNEALAILEGRFKEYIASRNTAPAVKQQMAAFLSSGVLPSDPLTVRTITALLAGTPYEQKPGNFIMDLRAVAGDTANYVGPKPQLGPEVPPMAGPNAPTGAIGGVASSAAAVANQVPSGAGPQMPPVAGQTGGADLPTGMPVRNAAANGIMDQGKTTAGSLADRIAAAVRASQGGGISAANDNGIGGGGPEGAAAVAAAQQQQAQQQGLAGGGYTAGQAEPLSQDDAQLIRFAMQQAGLNPDRLTRFSKIAGKALVPLLRARRAAFGIANGDNVGGLPDDIAGVAKSFTGSNGSNFYNQQQQYGNAAMQSETFKNAIAGLGDQEQVAAMYQSLMPLTYAGANPLIQQSAADTFDRQQNQFNDQQFNTTMADKPDPSGGIFTKFLQNQQNLDPITRRIFGLR